MQTAATPSIANPPPPKPGGPEPLAHQAIHDTVVGILEKLARGALLDVPAGQGALAARLIDARFEVRCCDLYPEIFRLGCAARS